MAFNATVTVSVPLEGKNQLTECSAAVIAYLLDLGFPDGGVALTDKDGNQRGPDYWIAGEAAEDGPLNFFGRAKAKPKRGEKAQTFLDRCYKADPSVGFATNIVDPFFLMLHSPETKTTSIYTFDDPDVDDGIAIGKSLIGQTMARCVFVFETKGVVSPCVVEEIEATENEGEAEGEADYDATTEEDAELAVPQLPPLVDDDQDGEDSEEADDGQDDDQTQPQLYLSVPAGAEDGSEDSESIDGTIDLGPSQPSMQGPIEDQETEIRKPKLPAMPTIRKMPRVTAKVPLTLKKPRTARANSPKSRTRISVARG